MSDFDVETLELIQTTAVAAAGADKKAVVLPLSGAPFAPYLLVDKDGAVTQKNYPGSPRKNRLGSVAEVVNYVDALKDVKESDRTTVWYDKSGVVVLINDDFATNDFRDRAFVPLRESKELAFVRSLADQENQFWDQKDFVSICRIKLAQCFGLEPSFLSIARSITFAASEQGHGTIGKSRESLGLEIENEVRSDMGEVPDEVQLQIRIFDDASILTRRTVRCAFDVKPRGPMRLMPLAGEIEAAVDAELESIGDMLRVSCPVPVFHGSPD
jgi:hypothetical protein